MTPEQLDDILSSLRAGVPLAVALAARLRPRLRPDVALATWRDTLDDDAAAGGDLRARAEAASEAGRQANAEASAPPGGADWAEPHRAIPGALAPEAIPAVSPSEAREQGSTLPPWGSGLGPGSIEAALCGPRNSEGPDAGDAGPSGDCLTGAPAVPLAEAVGADRERSPEGAGTTRASDQGNTVAPGSKPSAVEVARAAWAAVAETSARREAEERERLAREAPTLGYSKRASEATDDGADTALWQRRREEAIALGPGLFGYLLWVERRCVDFGLHPMDRHWLAHFEAFYASGKFIDIGRFGVRAAKSDSTMRAVTAETLLLQRHLEPGLDGVCPIMSANMREAGDRFDTGTQILRACGLRDVSGSRAPLEVGQFKTSGGGNAALVIQVHDSQGHPVEFRIYPASVEGAAGFTGIAGFGDELDLWGKPGGANPARKVIEVLVSRYTTQPEARLHLMSATYDRESEHAAMIDRGDTARQRVARLGVSGAAKDFEDRHRLAAGIRSDDPLLTAPSLDPMSTDIPCWVTNPIAPIEECYIKADGDVRRMFALYGGRPDLTGGGIGAADQCFLAAGITERLSLRFSKRPPPAQPGRVEPMKLAGMPPGDARYAGDGPRRPAPRTNWRTRGF